MRPQIFIAVSLLHLGLLLFFFLQMPENNNRATSRLQQIKARLPATQKRVSLSFQTPGTRQELSNRAATANETSPRQNSANNPQNLRVAAPVPVRFWRGEPSRPASPPVSPPMTAAVTKHTHNPAKQLAKSQPRKIIKNKSQRTEKPAETQNVAKATKQNPKPADKIAETQNVAKPTKQNDKPADEIAETQNVAKPTKQNDKPTDKIAETQNVAKPTKQNPKPADKIAETQNVAKPTKQNDKPTDEIAETQNVAKPTKQNPKPADKIAETQNVAKPTKQNDKPADKIAETQNVAKASQAAKATEQAGETTGPIISAADEKKNQTLLPLPPLKDERDYAALPLPGIVPAGYEPSTEKTLPEAILSEREDQINQTSQTDPIAPPVTLQIDTPAPAEPAVPTQTLQPATNAFNGSILDSAAATASAGSQSSAARVSSPGTLPSVAPLQNGRELHWSLDWLGQSQRRLLHWPSLQFPAPMLQGLKEQSVEIIFQVDANGNVVSVSFAGAQLQAYNWQINSMLLEKAGQFRFEAQNAQQESDTWLQKGKLRFLFLQNQNPTQIRHKPAPHKPAPKMDGDDTDREGRQ